MMKLKTIKTLLTIALIVDSVVIGCLVFDNSLAQYHLWVWVGLFLFWVVTLLEGEE